MDNYLDGGYHVEHLHKDLSSGLDLSTYEMGTVTEHFSVQRVSGGGQNEDPRLGQGAKYAFLYPNLMLNRYGPWLDTNAVFPTGRNTSRVVYDYYLESGVWIELRDRGELEPFVETSLEASNQVQLEDSMICGAVQLGLESSGYDVGRYAPKVEFADLAFHRRLADQYRAAVLEEN